jgi:hypothetical protein
MGRSGNRGSQALAKGGPVAGTSRPVVGGWSGCGQRLSGRGVIAAEADRDQVVGPGPIGALASAEKPLPADGV